MPVYEYRCTSCGKLFEINCHLSEREQLAVCPQCSSREVQPVFSSFTTAPPAKW